MSSTFYTIIIRFLLFVVLKLVAFVGSIPRMFVASARFGIKYQIGWTILPLKKFIIILKELKSLRITYVRIRNVCAADEEL